MRAGEFAGRGGHRQQFTIDLHGIAIAAFRQAFRFLRAREADFEQTLDGKLGDNLHLTNARHLPGVEPAGPASHEVDGLAARADGNTVQLDRELLSMTQAAGEFARAQTALAAKFRLVRYAINEAR